MNIVILGATGYLGKKLIKQLTESYKDASLYCIHRITSDLSALKEISVNIQFYLNEDSDMKCLFHTLREQEVVVINASCRYMKDATEQEILESNFEYPLRVLQIALEEQVKLKYINLGTALPHTLNIYAQSKMMLNEQAKVYCEKYKQLQYINIELQNYYGENEPSGRFLSDCINKLMNNEAIPLTTGEQKRDFIYIQDVISALVLLVDHKQLPQYLNMPLGSGSAPTIRDVVTYLKEQLHSDSELQWGKIPLRKNEPSLCADLSTYHQLGGKIQYNWKQGLKKVIVDVGKTRQGKGFKYIPIAMVCDGNFAMQTAVALTSMKKNKKQESYYHIFIIYVDCGMSALDKIRELESNDFKIDIIPASLDRYEAIRQIAHVSKAGLVKFDICDLISEYDKILYVDGDMIIRCDLTALYHTELQDNYVACVPHSLAIVTGKKKMNSGLMLLNAKKIREENIRDVLLETRLSYGDRNSMDQETFHQVFADRKLYLPMEYNIMLDKVKYERKYYSVEKYNQMWHTNHRNRKDIIKTAKIIHFTGAIKPWIFDFTPCEAEWQSYYLQSPYRGTKIAKKSKWDYYKNLIKKNGVRGIWWDVKDLAKELLGEYFHIYDKNMHQEWK